MNVLIILLILLSSHFCYASTFEQRDVESLKTRLKIAQLATKDQLVRKKMIVLLKQGELTPDLINFLMRIDRENLVVFKKLYQRLDLSSLSEDKAYVNDIWLLTQHADSDPAFQRKILHLFAKLAAFEPSELKHYAYLYDRVQVNYHLPQRFGTQGHCAGKHHWIVSRIEDLRHLDQFRSWAGLDSFASYQTLMNTLCP